MNAACEDCHAGCRGMQLNNSTNLDTRGPQLSHLPCKETVLSHLPCKETVAKPKP